MSHPVFPVFPIIFLIAAIILKLFTLRGKYNLSLKDLLFKPIQHSSSIYIGFYKIFETGGIVLFPSISTAPSRIYFTNLFLIFIFYHALIYTLYKLLIQKEFKL
jgi:uncharacterized SAM-binding protein YcdF (DUF218 family)